jgi:hypothetical protein
MSYQKNKNFGHHSFPPPSFLSSFPLYLFTQFTRWCFIPEPRSGPLLLPHLSTPVLIESSHSEGQHRLKGCPWSYPRDCPGLKKSFPGSSVVLVMPASELASPWAPLPWAGELCLLFRWLWKLQAVLGLTDLRRKEIRVKISKTQISIRSLMTPWTWQSGELLGSHPCIQERDWGRECLSPLILHTYLAQCEHLWTAIISSPA